VPFRRSLLSLAALALPALGCGGSSQPTCKPDLTVNWQIVESGTGAALTCGDADASSILVTVNSDVTSAPCPTDQSEGAIPIPLTGPGKGMVTVELQHAGATLATSATQTIVVTCDGPPRSPVFPIEVAPPCYADLAIPWRIVSAVDGRILTCAEAGNADTVVAQIDGGGLTSQMAVGNLCSASDSEGSLFAVLPTSGDYNISLQLRSGV
jgi:hypothetical protein